MRSAAGLRRSVALGGALLLSVSTACVRQPAALSVPAPSELPSITTSTIVIPDTAITTPRADPLATVSPARRVSVHAVDADVRTLLLAVAREAGLNLIVSGDVRGRVSVALDDVPAAEALRAIIQFAGLAIAGPAEIGATAAVVFYQLPVNINTASAATIAARFGTSAELANFVVEIRAEKPKAP